LKTVAAKLYEGMFLVDSALAASDWQGVIDTIRSILDRAGVEIVSVDKWDERKLAYGIKGKSRGTYILAYFRAQGSQVAPIERAAMLSEDIMRVLILCVEGVEERYLTRTTQDRRIEESAPAEQETSPEALNDEPQFIEEEEQNEVMEQNETGEPRNIGDM
jgi:small subunit ribosomal protein S6